MWFTDKIDESLNLNFINLLISKSSPPMFFMVLRNMEKKQGDFYMYIFNLYKVSAHSRIFVLLCQTLVD